jgi:hypothetical protein
MVPEPLLSVEKPPQYMLEMLPPDGSRGANKFCRGEVVTIGCLGTEGTVVVYDPLNIPKIYKGIMIDPAYRYLYTCELIDSRATVLVPEPMLTSYAKSDKQR